MYDCTIYSPPFSLATGSYVCALVGGDCVVVILLFFMLDGYDNRSFLFFYWSAPISCRRQHPYHLTPFDHHQQSLLVLLVKETITTVATDFIVNSLSLSLFYWCPRHVCHIIANKNESCSCDA